MASASEDRSKNPTPSVLDWREYVGPNGKPFPPDKLKEITDAIPPNPRMETPKMFLFGDEGQKGWEEFVRENGPSLPVSGSGGGYSNRGGGQGNRGGGGNRGGYGNRGGGQWAGGGRDNAARETINYDSRSGGERGYDDRSNGRGDRREAPGGSGYEGRSDIPPRDGRADRGYARKRSPPARKPVDPRDRSPPRPGDYQSTDSRYSGQGPSDSADRDRRPDRQEHTRPLPSDGHRGYHGENGREPYRGDGSARPRQADVGGYREEGRAVYNQGEGRIGGSRSNDGRDSHSLKRQREEHQYEQKPVEEPSAEPRQTSRGWNKKNQMQL